MARASGVTLTIETARVPVFRGVLAIAAANRSGGLTSNQEHFAAGVAFDAGIDAAREAVLFDPQTSGGLLVAVSAESVDQAAAAFAAAGVAAVRIGGARQAQPGVHIVAKA
jgi:selenide, water dikinase